MLDFVGDPAVPTRGGRGTEGRIQNLDMGTVAASTLLVGFACEVLGWAIVESTGAAVAKVRLRDGRDATGEVIAPISLGAGGQSIILATPLGISADAGVFLQVVAGSVEVVLFFRAPA